MASAEWVIEQHVARGSFGDVLRVHSRKAPGEPLAMKRVDSAKFRDVELCIMRNEHPSLVHCVQHFIDNGFVHLVMELAACSLHELIYLRRDSHIPFMNLAYHIMSGVAHLHHHGYAHCDIKPENVLYYEPNVFRLGDFGCALPIYGSGAEIHGTHSYMSPEILEYVSEPSVAKRPSLAPADCWSCGATLLEALLRKRVFGHDGPYKNKLFEQFVASGDDLIGILCDGDRSRLWHVSIVRMLMRSRVDERYTASECVARIRHCAGMHQLQQQCSSSDED